MLLVIAISIVDVYKIHLKGKPTIFIADTKTLTLNTLKLSRLLWLSQIKYSDVNILAFNNASGSLRPGFGVLHKGYFIYLKVEFLCLLPSASIKAEKRFSSQGLADGQ